MTPPAGMPSESQVRQAFTQLVEQARHNGHRPSVLALARQLALSNTTFRRHYPEIVKELAQIRRTPAIEHTDSPAATKHARVIARNAKLRRDNRQLRQHLDLAAANIARLTIDNHQLRQQLEQAHRITNIASRNAHD
jgi:DNA-binding transcriptional regulator YhcF (GntR family)